MAGAMAGDADRDMLGVAGLGEGATDELGVGVLGLSQDVKKSSSSAWGGVGINESIPSIWIPSGKLFVVHRIHERCLKFCTRITLTWLRPR
jgi:hypothetical protein